MDNSSNQSDPDGVLREFESAWATGETDLHQFVENWKLSADTLIKLAECDLSQQWDHGSRPIAENYLMQFPELAELEDSVGRLVRAEQESRRKHSCEIRDSESPFSGSSVASSSLVDNPDDPVALPQTISNPQPTSGPPPESDPATDRTIIRNQRTRVDLDPLPFKAIGRYTIRKVLGRGGEGTVYRAFDEVLGRDVAIKVPHSEMFGENSTLACESRHEARVVAQLHHDHITRIYDVNSTDTLPCYLVTQFISGQNLGTRMRNGNMVAADAVALVVSMADALQHAHSQGVIHRDVKPGNILVDESGKPWLADFGLAVDDDSLARRGELAGTPSYASDRQLNVKLNQN